MPKSRKSRSAAAQPASAVHPEMLAQYLRAAQGPTMREEVQTLRMLIDDYQALMTAGDLVRGLGAGLELVDLGLRIAATLSPTDMDRKYKAGFFGQHFGSMTSRFGHAHVGRLAEAAVAAEQALAATSRKDRA